MCELIKANKILAKTNLGEQEIKKSLVLIRNAIKKGIFNDMVYGFWFNQDEDKLFQHWGLHGIPLSADILFLISEKEKKALEKLIYKED